MHPLPPHAGFCLTLFPGAPSRPFPQPLPILTVVTGSVEQNRTVQNSIEEEDHGHEMLRLGEDFCFGESISTTAFETNTKRTISLRNRALTATRRKDSDVTRSSLFRDRQQERKIACPFGKPV
jgi:hypothetical protein